MSTSLFLLVLLTALLHSSWNLVAKKLGGNIVVLWFGFGIISLFSLPIVFQFVVLNEIPGKAFLIMAISGSLTSIYLLAMSKAYVKGEISFVYPLARGIAIAGTALLAPFVLHQNASLLGGIGISSVCIGILLIGLKIKGEKIQEGLFFSVIMGVMTISYSLLDSIGVQMVNPIFYNSAFMAAGMIFLTPYILLRHRKEIIPAWKKWKWHGLFIGFSSMSVYLLILFAFRSGVTSYVMAIRDISVAFGAMFGFFLLKEKCTLRKAFGILVILLGIFLIRVA